MKLQDLMEDSEAARTEGLNVEQLSEAWPAAQRGHIAACVNCLEAAQDLLATREIFKGVASRAELAGPRVAARVVGAIQTRERGLPLPASLWSAGARYATRPLGVMVFLLSACSHRAL